MAAKSEARKITETLLKKFDFLRPIHWEVPVDFLVKAPDIERGRLIMQ